MDGEYELLPHEKVEQLKKEVEKYKNNPFVKDKMGENLYKAIRELTRSMNQLTSVFREVKQEIIQEHEDGRGPDEKIDRVLNQNKTIAEALVSFGERMEELSTNIDTNMTTKNQDTTEQKQEEPQPERKEPQQPTKKEEPHTNFENGKLKSFPQELTNPFEQEPSTEQDFDIDDVMNQNTQQNNNMQDFSNENQEQSFSQQNDANGQQSFSQQNEFNNQETSQPQQEQPTNQQTNNEENKFDNFKKTMEEEQQGNFNQGFTQPQTNQQNPNQNEIPNIKQVSKPRKKRKVLGLF